MTISRQSSKWMHLAAVLTLAAVHLCYASNNKCFSIAVPKPNNTTDNCSVQINGKTYIPWPCSLITTPGGAICGTSNFETGLKTANPATIKIEALSTIKVGVSQLNKNSNQCYCGGFTDTGYKSINVEWCNLTSDGCENPWE